MKREETRTCIISLDSLGILHIKVLEGAVINKEDAANNFFVARSITGSAPFLKLVDVRNKFTILKDTKDVIWHENNGDNPMAKAILISSGVEKYIRNFLLSLINVRFPLKIFTSEHEAIAWLVSFKRKRPDSEKQVAMLKSMEG